MQNFAITGGPSLFDLGLALLRDNPKSRKKVIFNYRDTRENVYTQTMTTEFTINSLERGDSDKAWIFEGYRTVPGTNVEEPVSGAYTPSLQRGYFVTTVESVLPRIGPDPKMIIGTRSRWDFITALLAGRDRESREPIGMLYLSSPLNTAPNFQFYLNRIVHTADPKSVWYYEGSLGLDGKRVHGTYSFITDTGSFIIL